MASGITYNGVEGVEGGTIFKDTKFWLAQRLPMRSYFIDLIKQNGGTVVPLERQADMLIADELRKDVPAGSYSYNFILDSVKNGYIQVPDRYLIGRHPDEPRPVGSHQPSKSTRTPFTTEDDARLARWALEHPTEQRGNRIWQEYERINPRHTAQSWRDRFIKKLQILDRKKLEKMAATATEETVPDENVSRDARGGRNMMERKQQKDALQQPPERPTANPNEPSHRTAPLPQSTTWPLQSTSQDQQPRPTIENDQEDDPLALARHGFFQDLDEYIFATDRDIKRYLKINGKTIDLFDLTQAISAAPTNQDSQIIDWYRAAENLGFVDPDHNTVNELQLCYEGNLMDFLEQMESFEAKEEEEEEEEESPVSPGVAPDVNHEQDIHFEDGQDSGIPQSYVRSSPPVAVSKLKRTAGQLPFTSSGQLAKRRRYYEDEEIPSTPDAELGSKLPLAQEPSPTSRRIAQWRDYVGESEASQHLPPLPPIQDESQDLGIVPTPRRDVRHRSVDDAPLSNHQVLDSTPILLHLNKSRQQRSSHDRRQESFTESVKRSHDSTFADQAAPRRAVSSAKPNPKPVSQPAVRRSLPASFNTRNQTPQKSQTRSSDKSNSREIQKWISHYESMGYRRHIVVEALTRTTLTPGNMALLVMKHLSEGREVPPRHEGIWTDRDDADLQFSSSVDFSRTPTNASEDLQQDRAQKAHNRLVNKHGYGRLKVREAFLKAQSAEGRNNFGK
ncbi:hypothetical protein F53441_12671 [Fusarium austroafricanum]|uniref:DNA-binding protein RAP1 n=1 Tax=Fusarium austroafricanum TaxID=2364996 RepID=A0A8H4JU23_9HYPO|nr:hypothetical protein F53441_12671 [Fusarium austroafricanum]